MPEITLEMFGDLEDGPTGLDDMKVRVLGFIVGESDGWFHWNGHCVVCPHFRPSIPFFNDKMPTDMEPESIGLIIDYYLGYAGIVTVSPDTPQALYSAFAIADIIDSIPEEG